ncbi:MAG: restriction endonuclease [Paludibacteraceae bacterium]
MTKEQTMYMVRAGEGAFLIEDFLKQRVVAIAWGEIGDLSLLKDVEEIKEKLCEVYPEYKAGQINNFAGQLTRFKTEFEIGQLVVSYDSNQRVYWIGEIVSDYIYDKPKEIASDDASDTIESYPHRRKVKWTEKVSRDELTTATKNSLGSVLTIFKLPDLAVQEVLGRYKKGDTAVSTDVPDDGGQTLYIIQEDFEAKANDFIKDKLYKLDGYEMQDLVAGILRGMGYKTLVSPKGADRGKDITASPDGLGLENPKIMVEVKHRKGQISAPDVRSFIGGLRENDKALYVSTGGFTKEAKYEADRSNIPLTLIDMDLLVLLIVQHYDKFDPDTRALIPLKKLYWPVG